MKEILLVTGGNGYIGHDFTELAALVGFRIILLGRREVRASRRQNIQLIRWSMTSEIPDKAIKEAMGDGRIIAVVHLAHDWENDRLNDGKENIQCCKNILEYTRRIGCPKFIFASSVNAAKNARNAYGRVKWQQEQLLKNPGEIAARIGFVYGGKRNSQWGILCNIVEAIPVLPIIGANRPIHPIHLKDTINDLLGLVRNTINDGQIYYVAGRYSLTFGKFLQLFAHYYLGRGLFIINLPEGPIIALATLASHIGLFSSNLIERLNGLTNLQAIDPTVVVFTPSSDISDIEKKLSEDGSSTRRYLIREAQILMAYLNSRPGYSAIKRYVRYSEIHVKGQLLYLGWHKQIWPSLIAFSDTRATPNTPHSLLHEKLNTSLQILEFAGGKPSPYYQFADRSWLRTALTLLVLAAMEVVLVPLRYFQSR